MCVYYVHACICRDVKSSLACSFLLGVQKRTCSPNFLHQSVCLSVFLHRDTILRVSGTCCFSQSLARPPLFCCTHLGVGGESGPVTSSSLLPSPF